MNTAPTYNPLEDMMACPSKEFLRMVTTAERKYNAAVKNSMFLIMPSLVIAMYENTDIRWPEVMAWKQTLIEIIDVCAADPNLTIFQVLEEETGLELQVGDGVSYRDTTFANGELFDQRMMDKNPKKWILYYQKKAKWSTVTVMAACLLAGYRQFGWEPEGLMSTMREEAEYIMDWYKRKVKPIHNEFEKVTGHKPDELWEDVKK